MERRVAVVREMVEYGYALFGETVEQFAERFTLEQLEMFSAAFKGL